MYIYTIKNRISKYENAGQRAEQDFIYNFFGVIKKADNVSYKVSGDYQDYQIKYYHGEIARGQISIYEHIMSDAAENYVYIFRDYTAVIMDKNEYIRFTAKFADKMEYRTDKAEPFYQIRFKRCENNMRKWIASQM